MFIDKGNSYKHEFIKLHPSDETQSVKSKMGIGIINYFFLAAISFRSLDM